MTAYLSLLSVILLALVAGLMLALWLQLRDWREANRKAPLLAEQLAEQLLSARKGLHELKQVLTAQAPELNRLLGEGSKVRLELQLLLQRAEQAAARLETTVASGAGPVVTLAPVAEKVAGANGHAAGQALAKPERTVAEKAASDPLEELLAGLQQAGSDTSNVTPIGRRARSGPVTQAELDLQQSIKAKGAR